MLVRIEVRGAKRIEDWGGRNGGHKETPVRLPSVGRARSIHPREIADGDIPTLALPSSGPTVGDGMATLSAWLPKPPSLPRSVSVVTRIQSGMCGKVKAGVRWGWVSACQGGDSGSHSRNLSFRALTREISPELNDVGQIGDLSQRFEMTGQGRGCRSPYRDADQTIASRRGQTEVCPYARNEVLSGRRTCPVAVRPAATARDG